MIDASIASTLAECKIFLEKKAPRDVIKAARAGLARTLPSLVADLAHTVAQGLNISEAKIRNKYLDRKKFLTGGLTQMKVEAIARERGLFMTDFVRGSKVPEKQQGKHVANRRKISVSIRPGTSSMLKASGQVSAPFIIRGKGGTMLLMRRYRDASRATGKSSKGGHAGSTPGVPLHRPMRTSSPAARVSRQAAAEIIARAVERYQKEFKQALNYFLSEK